MVVGMYLRGEFFKMTKLFGPYNKRNRTASMQLSINAIVILVMAMAVLGLGLGLIRGVLGSGKDKLMSSLQEMDLTEPATAEKPITNINNIELKNNKDNEFIIGFYNADYPGCDVKARLNVSCSGATLGQSPIELKVSSGESKKLGSIIKPTGLSGTLGCTIAVDCYNEENDEWVEQVSDSAFVKIQS